MPIENRIVNGSFEEVINGPMPLPPPWIAVNSNVQETPGVGHIGERFVFLDDRLNSFICQYVEVNPGESFEFKVSLSNNNVPGEFPILPNAPIFFIISYYNDSFEFLGNGLNTYIAYNKLTYYYPSKTWSHFYAVTTPAPPGTTKGLVLINKLAPNGYFDSEIFVDDVMLTTYRNDL